MLGTQKEGSKGELVEDRSRMRKKKKKKKVTNREKDTKIPSTCRRECRPRLQGGDAADGRSQTVGLGCFQNTQNVLMR